MTESPTAATPPGAAPPPARREVSAFAKTYGAIHGPFARYCASRCLGADDGTLDDVMQEAILGALERMPAPVSPQRLLAYLIGVAKRQLANRLRAAEVRERYARQRRRQLRRRLPDDPDAAVELALVLEAVDRLPERAREALLLTALSGLTLRELAAVQGGTEAAAKARVHRARKRLLAVLAEPNRAPSRSARTTTPAAALAEAFAVLAVLLAQ